jgi:hypothetical protein
VTAPILTFDAAPDWVAVAVPEVLPVERVAGVVVAPALVVGVLAVVDPPTGVEGVPPGTEAPALIWAWTVALNWPDIPARLEDVLVGYVLEVRLGKRVEEVNISWVSWHSRGREKTNDTHVNLAENA